MQEKEMVGMDTVMCGTEAERGVGPLQYQFTDIQKVVLAAYGQCQRAWKNKYHQWLWGYIL